LRRQRSCIEGAANELQLRSCAVQELQLRAIQGAAFGAAKRAALGRKFDFLSQIFNNFFKKLQLFREKI